MEPSDALSNAVPASSGRQHAASRRALLRGGLAASAIAIAAPGSVIFARRAQAQAPATWVGTWGASPLRPLPRQGLPPRFANQTLRQIVRISAGGDQLRVRLSNEYGTTPLAIGAAHVALAGAGPTIDPASNRPLTFGGRQSVTIPPGAPVLSDAVDLRATPLASLAISFYLPNQTEVTTAHPTGAQTAFLSPNGNFSAAAEMPVEARYVNRFFLAKVLVRAPGRIPTVVTFGDSITDGALSTPDSNNRWPDHLARRLLADPVNPAAVVNAGIGGNRLLTDGAGQSALARFDRDVLSVPGVTHATVMVGINDIGWPGTVLAPESEAVTVEDLIQGYQLLIGRAHARGVTIIGCTLTPFEGTTLQGIPGYYSAEKEVKRAAVNQWIRTSRAFDAVIDFDQVIRDPASPGRMQAAYNGGDWLHPGDAGYRAMGEAVDLALFRRT
jgi:lysophospholipase L1-like esterase